MKFHLRSIARQAWLAGAVSIGLSTLSAFAISENEIDLTNNGDFSLKTVLGIYGFGGNALVGNFSSQPAGTGVFEPFLTIEKHGSGGIESGYNTNGFSALYLNQKRPQWNNLLKVGDLATIKIDGSDYYGFELDANEPGNSKGLISIDNVRIYTSNDDNTASVKSNEAKLDSLGVLRWAMNDPLAGGSSDDAEQWIKLDGNQNQGNGGSGISDMILYVPSAAFAGSSPNDLVWFYNLDGVHGSVDSNLSSDAGYEEWRAVVSLQPPLNAVPDRAGTLLLLGLALLGLRIVPWRCGAS